LRNSNEMQEGDEKVLQKKFTLQNGAIEVLFRPLTCESASCLQLHFLYNFFYTIFDLPTQKWGSKK
jgi:hypothetical protein